MVSSSENDIRKTLALLLKQFLQQSNEQRIYMARIIDDYATQILYYYKSRLSIETKKYLEDFQGFHHWGDTIRKPIYTVKDIRRILKILGAK